MNARLGECKKRGRPRKHWIDDVKNYFIRIRSYDENFSFQNNHLVGRILIIQEKKFSPGPGFEPGSPALRAGAITTKPPRRSTGPSRDPIRE